LLSADILALLLQLLNADPLLWNMEVPDVPLRQKRILSRIGKSRRLAADPAIFLHVLWLLLSS
jgi:hypothetical protein